MIARPLLFSAGLWPALSAHASDAPPAETAPADAAPAEAPAPDLEAGEIVVITAERWEDAAQDVPLSVSVVTGETLENAAVVHGEDVLRLVPNVDWVGASGRPRFLLIRGVGDLGIGNLVTNPAVGILVDEVDLSGLGAGMALLDVDRVEVLRGPQGTLYGPNALGGLIKIESRAPTADPEGRIELRYGSRNTLLVSAAGGGRLLPRSDVLTLRAAAQLHRSDGFFDNATLDRKDTAYRDELGVRLRLRLEPSTRFRLDLMGAYVDVDDGYDHWSVDNTRTTYTDRPGRDGQRTTMGSMQIRGDAGPLRITSNTSLQSSVWSYASDWDWFGVDAPRPADSLAPEGYTVDLYNEQDTTQESFTEELRLSSRPRDDLWRFRGGEVRWQLGGFVHGVRQEMSTVLFAFGEVDDAASNASSYRRLAAAGFGQVDVTVLDRLTLTAGGRVERAWQDYEDATGFAADCATDDEALGTACGMLYGWRGAARVRIVDGVSVYASASQSSKLGGFNLDPLAPVRYYRPEVDRSYELGLRTHDARDGLWRANLTGFYVQRIDQQLSEWVQRPGGTAAEIFFYTDNADRAYSLGAELEVAGSPVRGLTLDGAVGLLDARIVAWSFGTGEGAVDYSGKVHAHAPAVTFSAAATYEAPFGLFGRVGVTGASKRYFANNNEIADPAYALLDVRLGWRGEHLGVSVWGRNVTDTRYAVAGFGPYFTPTEHHPFGNYYRWADPAVWGVSVEARL